MVTKRFPETLKIAALTEINRMMQASGVKNQLKGLLASGKRVYDCIKTCMDRQTNNCIKSLGCGLDLPPDSALVQTAKRCAIQSGFNTPAVQQLCNCAASAGIRQLQGGICNRIVIT
uniref:CFEM domain-containing protein n=1 Tax=Steinernema glaseri TaxID=37863 RepID=A0A1I7Z7V1_9BILA